ncbi:predicted protein [Chaetoceros tenuissimus]|uniref:Uncharacterized protein n=1 Tax=Chaetoceros tenuissimus TaxID=426638 RepID=A0AAD3CWD0_9STRA|nr:predicted protein [Chaetoceros tenuissimus]
MEATPSESSEYTSGYGTSDEELMVSFPHRLRKHTMTHRQVAQDGNIGPDISVNLQPLQETNDANLTASRQKQEVNHSPIDELHLVEVHSAISCSETSEETGMKHDSSVKVEKMKHYEHYDQVIEEETISNMRETDEDGSSRSTTRSHDSNSHSQSSAHSSEYSSDSDSDSDSSSSSDSSRSSHDESSGSESSSNVSRSERVNMAQHHGDHSGHFIEPQGTNIHSDESDSEESSQHSSGSGFSYTSSSSESESDSSSEDSKPPAIPYPQAQPVSSGTFYGWGEIPPSESSFNGSQYLDSSVASSKMSQDLMVGFGIGQRCDVSVTDSQASQSVSVVNPMEDEYDPKRPWKKKPIELELDQKSHKSAMSVLSGSVESGSVAQHEHQKDDGSTSDTSQVKSVKSGKSSLNSDISVVKVAKQALKLGTVKTELPRPIIPRYQSQKQRKLEPFRPGPATSTKGMPKNVSFATLDGIYREHQANLGVSSGPSTRKLSFYSYANNSLTSIDENGGLSEREIHTGSSDWNLSIGGSIGSNKNLSIGGSIGSNKSKEGSFRGQNETKIQGRDIGNGSIISVAKRRESRMSTLTIPEFDEEALNTPEPQSPIDALFPRQDSEKLPFLPSSIKGEVDGNDQGSSIRSLYRLEEEEEIDVQDELKTSQRGTNLSEESELQNREGSILMNTHDSTQYLLTADSEKNFDPMDFDDDDNDDRAEMSVAESSDEEDLSRSETNDSSRTRNDNRVSARHASRLGSTRMSSSRRSIRAGIFSGFCCCKGSLRTHQKSRILMIAVATAVVLITSISVLFYFVENAKKDEKDEGIILTDTVVPTSSLFPSSVPSVSQSPSASQIPSSVPSVSQSPSISQVPSSIPTRWTLWPTPSDADTEKIE